jgi:hypothetical protein
MTRLRARTVSRLGRGGFALPAVLALLIALSLVGSAAAILTSTEVRVATLYNLSNRASAAANAGLEHAVAHFGVSGSDDGWPVAGSIGGYDYSVAITRDSFDFGAGQLPVSWSAAAGYNTDDDGQPVWILSSLATRGPYQSLEELRVSVGGGTFQATSSLTSGSGMKVRGNVTISGVDASGDDSCGGDKPAVVLTDPDDDVDSSGSVDFEGDEAYADSVPPYVGHDATTNFNTPEEVLGLDPGALDGYQQTGQEFDADPPDTLSGVTYITGDFGSNGAGSGDIDGSGVLIVHNPLYDPREHDPSHPLYDPVKAADPTYAPATLGNINTGTFNGIVIADQIDKLTGNTTIFGSVVMLRRVDDGRNVATGQTLIQYSCTAIQTSTGGLGGPRRLAWSAR